ncbi:MAG TPA: hypothetical protein PKI10_14705 [Syntrophorhabdus sp.]|jgi:hypothetical protein|nr:hypothetical protein [Syntrophorhabdus sp.]
MENVTATQGIENESGMDILNIQDKISHIASKISALQNMFFRETPNEGITFNAEAQSGMYWLYGDIINQLKKLAEV